MSVRWITTALFALVCGAPLYAQIAGPNAMVADGEWHSPFPGMRYRLQAVTCPDEPVSPVSGEFYLLSQPSGLKIVFCMDSRKTDLDVEDTRDDVSVRVKSTGEKSRITVRGLDRFFGSDNGITSSGDGSTITLQSDGSKVTSSGDGTEITIAGRENVVKIDDTADNNDVIVGHGDENQISVGTVSSSSGETSEGTEVTVFDFGNRVTGFRCDGLTVNALVSGLLGTEIEFHANATNCVANIASDARHTIGTDNGTGNSRTPMHLDPALGNTWNGAPW